MMSQSHSQYPVICANCGGIGHVYKNCNHPVTSFGIICFRIVYNESTNSLYPEYLMVQRKDSLSYVEFIRGKYGIDNKTYLFELFSNMTHSERAKLSTMTFDNLWKDLWHIPDCNAYQKDYMNAKVRFNFLKRGYWMQNDQKNEQIYIDINSILENTISELEECEWGFPKGRRNINEQDFACALREFREETGVNTNFIHVIKDMKPFEEVFSGSNKVRYKHIYYLAMSMDNNQTLPTWTKHIGKEIKDVKWLSYEASQQKIRDYNVERKELLKRANATIVRWGINSCKVPPVFYGY